MQIDHVQVSLVSVVEVTKCSDKRVRKSLESSKTFYMVMTLCTQRSYKKRHHLDMGKIHNYSGMMHVLKSFISCLHVSTLTGYISDILPTTPVLKAGHRASCSGVCTYVVCFTLKWQHISRSRKGTFSRTTRPYTDTVVGE